MDAQADQLSRLMVRVMMLEHIVQVLLMGDFEKQADPIKAASDFAEFMRAELEQKFGPTMPEAVRLTAIEEGSRVLDDTVARLKALRQGP